MRSAALVLGTVFALSGCGWFRPKVVYDEETFAHKATPAFSVPLGAGGVPRTTVIGKRQTVRVQEGDTLIDIARYYDLGYNEIVEANPGVDPWVPWVGTSVVVPTEWVLPCCTYEGIVLNIPEMRLFFYRREGERLLVYTFPVGLGRDDRRTPRGKFTVRGKTVNPRWNIPASIRAEHIRERNDPRTSIPGGDPDNPLGKYRFELSISPYAIHGTNIPWGVGMEVSHGCARLYPEDMERLFPLVAVGTPGELVYQPVKIGRRAAAVFLEAHPDLYRLTHGLDPAARTALERAAVRMPPAAPALAAALAASHGLPVALSGSR